MKPNQLKQVFFDTPIFDAVTMAAARTAYFAPQGFSQATLFIDFTEGGSGITQLDIQVACSHEVEANTAVASQTYFNIVEESPAAPNVAVDASGRVYQCTVSSSNEKFQLNIPIVGWNAKVVITPNVTSANGLVTMRWAGTIQ